MSELRVLPNSIEAEQMVLGILLTDENAYTTISGIIKIEHFYNQANALLFKHMLELKNSQVKIEAVTLYDSLTKSSVLKTGYFSKLDFIDYINKLVEAAICSSSLLAYTQILVEKYQAREAIRIVDNLTFQILNPKDKTIKEIIASSMKELNELKPINQQNITYLPDIVTRLQNMQQNSPEYMSSPQSLVQVKVDNLP